MIHPPNFVRRRWICPARLIGQSQLIRILLSSLLSLFGFAVTAVCVSAQQTAGAGVSLAIEGDALIIKGVVADSPAGRSGLLKVNDRILEIGQGDSPAVAVKGMRMEDITTQVRGPMGSTVKLKIVSPGDDDSKARVVTFTRGAMFVPNPWGSDAGPAIPGTEPSLPSWVVSRLSPMRTQGSFLVILPPDYDKSTRKYPVCVLLHGAGGNERQFGTVSTQLGRDGVIFIAIRAPFSNPDGTIALKSPSYSAWPSDPIPNDSPVLDIALRDYVDWIFDAVSDVQKNYRAEEGKISLYGFSQGGRIALSAAAFYPERIKSYFASSGSVPPETVLTSERLQRMKQENVQVWMLHGREDQTVPVSAASALADRLKAASINVTFQIVTGGHEITDEMASVGKSWLDKVVRSGK